jgi:hypothetical protein
MTGAVTQLADIARPADAHGAAVRVDAPQVGAPRRSVAFPLSDA